MKERNDPDKPLHNFRASKPTNFTSFKNGTRRIVKLQNCEQVRRVDTVFDDTWRQIKFIFWINHAFFESNSSGQNNLPN